MDDGLIKTGNAGREKLDWSDWNLRFGLLLVGVFVVRVVFLALFPCDLVGDEAYYWDWGRRLSWGYFSKPPFIAWMMAFAGHLGGATPFGLRLWAVVFGMGATLFTFLLGRRMYGPKAGFWAAAFIAATPGAVLLNILLTIDAPLMFFWTGALLLFYLVTTETVPARRILFAALLCVDLGLGHLTKQMMWFFPVMGALYLALDGAEGRRKLRSGALLSAFAASYLFLVPTLVWNSRHGWITFVHTEHHFNGNGIAQFPKNIGEFLGTQILAISPVLLVLVFALAVGGIFVWKRIGSRERMLVVFGGLPLAVVCLMTLRQGINGNWPVVFYPAGVILVAGWAFAQQPFGGFDYARRLRSWIKPALWVAVAMSAIFYALPYIVSAAQLKGAKIDPYARLRGWAMYARAVQTARSDMPRSDAPILVVGHRYYASELAYYLPDHPRIYHWATPGEIDSQYEIWGGLDALKGSDVLIVMAGKSNEVPAELPAELRAGLAASAPKGVLMVNIGNGRIIKAQVYWGSFIGAPASAATTDGGDK